MSGRVVSFLLLFTVVAVQSSLANVASIQDSAPPGLDLAALTLRPGDVAEPGWKHAGAFMEDLASEAEIAASYRGDGSTAEDASEQLVAFGWRRMYVDVLDGPTGANAAPNRRIRSYITEYASAEGAAAGFLYLEDEGAIASAEDVPGTRPFGEQFELTSDKGTSGVDGRPFRSLDLTFRAGNLVVGVTAIAYGATAADPSIADVEALGSLLERRLGATPEGKTLGTRIVRFGGDELDVVTYDDAYYRLTREDVPLVDESLSAAARRIASYDGAGDVYQLWQGIDIESADGVLYGVTALRFPDEAAATSWMDALVESLGSNPFYGDPRPIELPANFAYPAVALDYISGGSSPDGPRSVLVAVRVGAEVARVHVVPQGRLSDVPLDAVTTLAGIEADCLGGGECAELMELPASLAVSEPVASPVPSE